MHISAISVFSAAVKSRILRAGMPDQTYTVNFKKSSKIIEKSLKTYFSTSDSLAGSDDRAGGNGSSFANVGTVQDGYTLANQTIIINGAGVDNGSVLNDNILANSSGKIVINVDGHIVLNVRLFSHLDASEIGYQHHAQLKKYIPLKTLP